MITSRDRQLPGIPGHAAEDVVGHIGTLHAANILAPAGDEWKQACCVDRHALARVWLLPWPCSINATHWALHPTIRCA